MNKTKIPWTDDTWNPVTGCHNECPYCYANRITKRFTNIYPNGFEPTFYPERLKEPSKRKKPTLIFVCSMADLFGSWIPTKWILDVLKVVHENPRHTFQFLTKNPERYKLFNPWPKNVWLGATATNQDMANDACLKLGVVQAKVKFLSLEPLLSPITISPYMKLVMQWVIVGAQTGPGARQPERNWVTDIIDQSRDIKVFCKPNLKMEKLPMEMPVRNGGSTWQD